MSATNKTPQTESNSMTKGANVGALSKLGNGEPDGVGNASKIASVNAIGVSGASTGGYSGGSAGGESSDDIAAGTDMGASVEPTTKKNGMGGGTGDGGVGGLGSGAGGI